MILGMSRTPKTAEKKSDWKKVGPCLYRYKGGTYYGWVKNRGKQIRQSLETDDCELARRRLRELRHKLENTDPELSRRTMAQHRKLFEALLSGKDKTVANEKRALRYLVEQWPKDAPDILSKIKPSHIAAWLKPFRDRLAPASVNLLISVTRKFFDLAVEDRVIDQSPAQRLKYLKREQPIRLTPTEEQFRSILADLRRQTFNGHGPYESADFVELAGTLGLGQAELSDIQRQHIDLAAGVIKVFRQKTAQHFTIPIFPDARPIIERRLADMPSEPTARLLPHDNCKKALEGACRRLGLPRFTPRSLRRYHITRALRAGIDAPTVADWQGHRDGGALILRTYQAEVNLKHSLSMAAKLGPKPDNVIELRNQQAAG
jgi:integrase